MEINIEDVVAVLLADGWNSVEGRSLRLRRCEIIRTWAMEETPERREVLQDLLDAPTEEAVEIYKARDEGRNVRTVCASWDKAAFWKESPDVTFVCPWDAVLGVRVKTKKAEPK